jgi:hypothetical protein
VLATACGSSGDDTTAASTTTQPATSGATDTPTSAGPGTGDSGETSAPAPTTTAATVTSDGSETSTTTAPTGDTADSTGGEALPDCAVAPCFNVVNNCGFPLTIHAANNAAVVLEPDNTVLAPGARQQYAVPAEWPAGRVTAYYLDPAQNPEAHDKVEMTVTGGVMNYNITYVDWVSLPAEMVAVGPACAPTDQFDPKIGCYVPRDEILDGCPAELLVGERCLSAGLFCADPGNQALPYCHALDAKIAECAAMHPETCGVAAQLGDATPQAYACAGYFDSQPPNCMPAAPDCHFEGNKWCAALNRGMLADPESVDTAAYYQSPPFNTYAQWVHATCPGIYAFPYDDYPSNAGESGFRSCASDRLDITFCPAG